MQIDREQLIECPCCKDTFLLRHRPEFKIQPMSKDEIKYLQKLQEDLLKLGIVTNYIC